MKIQGRTFIVSGGASGLGKGCCVEIVARGGHVAVLDQNEENGLEFVAEIGAGAKFFQCDVLSSDSVAKAVEGASAWAKETGKPVAGAICAAGVSLPAAILDRNGNPFDLGDFEFVMGVNVRGTIDLARQTCAEIVKNSPFPASEDRGIIIMVASSAAFDGQNGQVSYSASKGAITALTLPLARDVGRHGIRAVTIAPSLFETRMTSVMSDKVRQSLEKTFVFPKRAGRPDEFAATARHCIENEMLNGTVIRLDGATRMTKM